jgi:hypothetical protein
MTPIGEEGVRELTATLCKMVHGLRMYDVQRALVAVMSCGVCTSSHSQGELEEMLDALWVMLLSQVHADYPKIKAMREKGEVNELVLPEQRH